MLHFYLQIGDWAKDVELSIVQEDACGSQNLNEDAGDTIANPYIPGDNVIVPLTSEFEVMVNNENSQEQINPETHTENKEPEDPDNSSSIITPYPETPTAQIQQDDMHNNAFTVQTPSQYTWPQYDPTSVQFGSTNNVYVPNVNNTYEIVHVNEMLSFDTSSVTADMSSFSMDTSLMADTSIGMPSCMQMTGTSSTSQLNTSFQTPNLTTAHLNGGSDGTTPNIESHDSTTPNVSYPLVYVSPAGLLTVLFKHDIAVELTADHTIRVVNHRHKCVAATNKRASASCIYHTAAKIYQDVTHVDAEVYWDRKARLTPSVFHYGWSGLCFKVDSQGYIMTGNFEEFRDLSKDNSVTLLFSSSAYGPHLVPEYERIARASKFHYLSAGAVSVYINGIKIKQSARGDVTVTSGPKFIRVSPITGSVTLKTHFVDMAVDKDWNVRVSWNFYGLLGTCTSDSNE